MDAPPITTPEILWRTRIGIQSWLNNPIIVGNRVFAGSSGRDWNRPDPLDGVYALDLATGQVIWFTAAANDVNGLAYADGSIVVTGDEGAVWAIGVETGRVRWRERIGTGKTYTNPLVVGGVVVVGSADGSLYAIDLSTGSPRWSRRLGGSIRGGAASDGTTIYAASTSGSVAAFSLDGTNRWQIVLTRPSFERTRQEPAEIYAAPTVVGDLLILTFTRDTYYDTPALVGIDRASGAIRWRASAPTAARESWGNVRSSPAVYKELLIYGEPYSNRVVAVGAKDGLVRWSSALGFCMFPQWPSPAIGGRVVLLPRHDGGLYAIDADTGNALWSLYLGDAERAGSRFPPDIMPPRWPNCAWKPNVGRPIFSSPAVAGTGTVVIGTDEGFLFGIGDAAFGRQTSGGRGRP